MKTIFTLIALMGFFSSQVQAEVYEVDDIRVLGLQRVSPDTVFNAIDVSANSQVSDDQIQKMIRDLYNTGYFESVEVGRDGDLLVLNLEERPVISSIIIEGNKAIPEEALLDGLKGIGLADGEVFKASALDQIDKQLAAQYSALGRYAAEIDIVSKLAEQNQVIIGIRIDEGEVAKIKYINIVGNNTFPEEELRLQFELNTTGIWSWASGNDKYARERLAGDIERLRSYYLDRGYLEFSVTSTQVSLSPDKETVFITVNIDEGKPYSVNKITIEGDPVIPEEQVKKLIGLQVGDTFSQLRVTNSEQAIRKRLANDGYSAAQVSGVPDLDKDKQLVDLAFYVKPGEVSYVRRIAFSGNNATADYVLRREMRQLEGAPVSAEKLEQSRLRLQRLGLFSDVKLTTRNVPGTSDQVDVEFEVTEQSTATLDFSLGYSSGSGLTIGAGLQHKNWLGTGNTLGFDVERSDTETSYSFNYTNPYFTADGVSRGISLYYRERDYEDISVTNYTTDTAGMKVTFGYPVSETARLIFGLGFENIKVEAGTITAQEIQGTPVLRDGVDNAYVSESFYTDTILPALNGFNNADTNNNDVLDEKDNLYSSMDLDALDLTDYTLAETGYDTFTSSDDVLRERTEGFLDLYGSDFDTFSLSSAWSSSALDRAIFPTSGISQRFDAEITVPGGDLEFYKLKYRGDIYFPVTETSAFHIKGRLGYGDVYGNMEAYPFFENFYAGGVGSVRGFESSSLGPKATPATPYAAVPVAIDPDDPDDVDVDDITYVYVLADDGQLLTQGGDDLYSFGGNVLFETSVELSFPMPFVKNSDKARMVMFVDAGNVFSTDCGASQENCSDLDFGELSAAAGIGIQWLSPVGPLSFYFSRPIKEQPHDEPESFQFSLGRMF